MLTGDLVRPRLRRQGQELTIELLPVDDAQNLRSAGELIARFRAHEGETFSAWLHSLEAYESERMDYAVLRGLGKVLQDNAEFAPSAAVIPPAELRARLFAQTPSFEKADLFHPVTRGDRIQSLATELGVSAADLELALFADRPAEYRLVNLGPAWTPEDLITRYNLELARGVLYWANQMVVDVYDGFKTFWQYLKFFKLMFEAAPLAGKTKAHGYHVLLDGPLSPFVSGTTRYGRQMAAFLPALFLLEQWQMTSNVVYGGRTLTYRLDHTSPLRTHFKRGGLFDSRLEADFAAEFEAKFGGERGKWTLTREDEVLLLDDRVFIPDFAFTHKQNGRRALLELVGFWHPEYLKRKVEKIRAAQRRNLVLLVYEGVNLSADKLRDVPGEVLYFPNKPVLKDVLAAVERCAE